MRSTILKEGLPLVYQTRLVAIGKLNINLNTEPMVNKLLFKWGAEKLKNNRLTADDEMMKSHTL